MALPQCSSPGCRNDAAFRANSRPAWCDAHITDILAEGGLEPLEPFLSRNAYRLTRCLTCGVVAHYRFDYTLDQNKYGTPTCRACYWRDWYRIAIYSRPDPLPEVGSVDRGRQVMELLPGGPVLYQCLDCGRLTPGRPRDFSDVCGCSGALGGSREPSEGYLSPEMQEQFVETVKPSSLTSATITSTSQRLTNWRDPVCGHTWTATPRDRQRIPRWRCPECRTILDSLAYHFPEIASEWSPNNELSTWQVRPSGSVPKEPEWRCNVDPNHVWTATLNQRTSGKSRCPRCRTTGKSWIELDYLEAAREVFGNATSNQRIEHVAFQARRAWFPDITVQLDGSPSLLLIEYDGSYWHGTKADLDLKKTEDLLLAGALVVRLREHPLDSLDVVHPHLLQLPVPSAPHDLQEVLRQVTQWLDSRPGWTPHRGS